MYLHDVVKANKWFHFGITVDSKNNKVFVYINGIQETLIDMCTKKPTSILKGKFELKKGTFQLGKKGGVSEDEPTMMTHGISKPILDCRRVMFINSELKEKDILLKCMHSYGRN